LFIDLYFNGEYEAKYDEIKNSDEPLPNTYLSAISPVIARRLRPWVLPSNRKGGVLA
jgi:hypothetical protein